ncbi:MAG: CcmD family protein [Agriterribacter sp.]
MYRVIFKRIVVSFLFLISILFTSYAQEKVEMADAMRSNGKIYVVVTVLTVILIGLFVFLISIDRKVSRLEKNKAKQ